MAYIPHNKRDPDKERRNRLDQVGVSTAIIGVIVVAASTVVSLWSALIVQHQSKIMAAQTEVMRSQQRVMEAQQRPWISVQILPTRAAEFQKDGSFQLDYMVKAKNVGQAAAAGVDVLSEIVALDWSDATEIREEQNRFCDEIRHQTYRTPDNFGFLLFPGDEHLFVQSSAVTAKQVRRRSTHANGNEKTLGLMVIGCADYQFYVSKDHHQTRFAYTIQRLEKDVFDSYYRVVKGPRDETVFLRDVVVGKNVPPELLRFNRGLWGNGYAD